jgi:hypothetical protein
MNQALYAHMNNKTIKKKKERDKEGQMTLDNSFYLFLGSTEVLN